MIKLQILILSFTLICIYAKADNELNSSEAKGLKIGTKAPLFKAIEIADAYDVTFTPGGMQLMTYNLMLRTKLKKTHSDASQRLPIPATYIVDREGIIAWRQFDRDCKNRSSVKAILDALNTISG